MAEHTPTPWAYRPHRHDDWGWIRATSANGELAPLVAMARSGSWESAAFFDEHRANNTDPYGANAAFIVKAVNNHDLFLKVLEKIEGVAQKDSLTDAERLNDIRAVVRAMLAHVGGAAK